MEKYLRSLLEILKIDDDSIFKKENFSLYTATIIATACDLIPESSVVEFKQHTDAFSMITWTFTKIPGEKKLIKVGYIFFISDIEGYKSGYVGKYSGALIQTKIHLPETNDLNYFLESLRNAIPYVVTQQVH